jgi:hypothetical protein
MKSVVSRIVVALLLVTITGGAAFAKSQRTTVTFAVDTKVNETLVKRGRYEVIFNEERGELSILKGRKVIAKGTARLEMRESKARATELNTVKDDNETTFVSIAFDGSDQRVVLNQAGIQAGGND